MLVNIMDPRFCIRRIYERPHRYCLENGKSLWLPIWFPYGRFRSGFACGW